MKTIAKYILVCPFVLLFYCSWSQEVSPRFDVFHIEKPSERFRINLTDPVHQIDLINLKPGAQYSIHLAPSSGDLTNSQDVEVIFDQQKVVLPHRFSPASSSVSFLVNVNKPVSDQASSEYFLSVALIGSVKQQAGTAPESRSMLPPITIDPNFSAQELIEDIFIGSGCFDVSNVVLSGSANGLAAFYNGNSSIGYDNGFLMATGNSTNALGPNTQEGTSTTFSPAPASDPDLDQLVTFPIYDPVIIEFDFTPTVDSVYFNYTFASEEYCEWAPSIYNDVFGFFLSGPGINGTFSNGGVNLATLPNGNYVAINTVNQNTNSALFVCNSGDPTCVGLPIVAPNDIEYDGWTIKLTALAVVQPCETYHIKLAISDVGDPIWDSAVFFEAGSFKAGGNAGLNFNYPTMNSAVFYEDCGSGLLTFFRTDQVAIDEPLILTYTVDPASTATPGADYSANLPGTITIPAFQDSVSIPITVFEDFITEGQESIILILDNSCNCSTSEIEIILEDKPPLEVALDTQQVCNASFVTLTPSVTGGVPELTYAWSSGQFSPTITVVPSGLTEYVVTVSDACGQTAIDTGLVELLEIPTATLSGDGVICNNSTQADLLVTFTGSPPWDLVYAINGIDQPPITGITDNPYQLTITQAGTVDLTSVSSGPCPGVVSGFVIIPETEIILTPQVIDESCPGAGNGIMTVSIAGAIPPWNYFWSNFSSAPVITDLFSDEYSVTITDFYGCTATVTDSVTVGPPLLVNAIVVAQPDCNMGGSLDLNIGNASPPFTILWSDSSVVPNPTNLPPGEYSVMVEDLFGCSGVDTISLVPPPQIELDNYAIVETNCFNPSQGSIDVSVSGGIDSLFYLWSNGSTEQDLSNVPAGNYTLSVFDSFGCTLDTSFTITGDLQPPLAAVGLPDTLTCSSPIVVLDGSGSDSGAGYTIIWQSDSGNFVSDSTILNPQVDLPGTYWIVVQNDSSGCTASDSTTVLEDILLPTVSISNPVPLTCDQDSVNLVGSIANQGPNPQIAWINLNSGQQVDTSNLNIVIDQAGVYSLTVTNPISGCIGMDTVVVSIDTVSPVISIAAPDTISCVDTIITLNGNGSSSGIDFTNIWTTTNGTIINGQNTLSPTVGDIGIYLLTITNSQNGCISADSIQVTQDAATPFANAGFSDTLTCDVSSIVLDGSNSSQGALFSYTWTTIDGGVILNPNSDSPTISEPGTYTLTVENINNGCTDEATVVIGIDTMAPQVEAGPPGLINCFNPTINLAGSTATNGSLTILWNTTNGSITNGINTLTPTVNGAGDYILTIESNDNGCVASDQMTVSIDTLSPVADAGIGGTLTCTVNQLNLDGSNSSSGANFTYNWSTNSGNIVSGQNQINPLIDAQGNYGLLVENTLNGCSDSTTVQVNLDTIIPVTAIASFGTISCVVDSALLDGTGSDTGPNFIYEWVTADGSIIGVNTDIQAFAGQAGTYFLIVTNSDNGCQDSIGTLVPDNFATPTADAGITAELNCVTTEIILDGGNSSSGPGYSVEWITFDGNIVNGGQSYNPTVNEAGTYTIVLTDLSSGCTESADVLITQDANLPSADAGPFGTLTCTSNTYQVDGSGSSFGPDVIFTWSTANGNIASGGNTLSPVVDLPGSYLLTLTDTSNNCVVTSTVVVDIDTISPGISFDNPDMLNCLVLSLPIEASISNAANNLISWSTPNGNILGSTDTASILVNSPGDYILNVINAENGCSSQDQIVVSQDTISPVSDAGNIQTLNCFQDQINIGGINTSSGPEYLYTWTLPDGSQWSDTSAVVTIAQQGLYNLLVTNINNGCTDQDQVMISDDFVAPTLLFNNPAELNCQVLQSDIEVSPGAGSNFAISWIDDDGVGIGNSAIVSVSSPGMYFSTVLNLDNGCSTTDSLEVTQDITPPSAEAGIIDTLNCLITSLSLDGQGSSVGPTYTYTWMASPGNILSGGNTLSPVINAAGTYTLEVTNNMNFCVSTDMVSIEQDTDAPLANINPSPPLTCITTELILDGSGSSTGSSIFYNWTSNGGNILSGGNTLNPNVNQDGQYTLTVTDSSNFCVTTADIDIGIDTISPSAVTDLPGAFQLDCDNTTLVIDGSGSSPLSDIVFLWSTQNGSIISGTTGNAVTIDEPGTYNLLITNTVNGCTAETTQQVGQDVTPPSVNILPTATLTCIIEEVTIDATGSSSGPGFQYQWAGGNILSGDNTLTPLVNAPGTYVLTITNTNNGCSATDNLLIDQDVATPTVVVGSEGALNCVSDVMNVLGIGSSVGPEYQYNWSTLDGAIVGNSNMLNIMVSSSGTYTLAITNNINGCQSENQINVSENEAVPSAISLDLIPPACKGQLGAVQINGATGGNPPYLYALNDGGFYPPSIFSNLPPGDYNITVQDVIGCEFEQTITIPEGEEINITLDPEITLILGSSTQIQASVDIPEDQISIILWTPDTYLSCTDCLDPYVDLPLNTILYRLYVESEKGCHDEAEILIKVQKPRDVFIPNVFSPNNQDGNNDVVYISANTEQVSNIKSFLIFDRWGELVYRELNFQPNDPKHGWDGTLKGEFLNPGVFVYWAEVEFIDGEVILYKGDITIPD